MKEANQSIDTTTKTQFNIDKYLTGVA